MESSTLSAYSVVIRWVDGSVTDTDFPMMDFTRAVSHDVQGHQVLLQHIGHLKGIWHFSHPAIRSQRRRLYVDDLKPRLEKDLKIVNKLIRFSKAEIGVFERNLSQRCSLTAKTNITLDLLNQAHSKIRQLILEIDTFADHGRGDDDILKAENLSRHIRQPPHPVTQFSRQHIRRSNIKLRIPELEAKQILMKKPTTSPTLVSCRPRCATCRHQACTCWKQPRVERVDSAVCFDEAVVSGP